jgi:hypothetical protein
MNYMKRKKAKVVQASKQDSQPSPELKEWLLNAKKAGNVIICQVPNLAKGDQSNKK